MTITTLSPEHFPLLRSVADGVVPPPSSIVVVAEKDGEIVGRMMVVGIAHVEGTWVAEGQRNGFIGRQLMEKIEQEAVSRGLGKLMAYSTSGEHDAYMHRLGFVRMPWTVWQKEIG